MNRADAFWTLASLTAICTASWVIGTFPVLAWAVLAAALLFVVVGSVVLCATAERKVVTRPNPALGRPSHLPLGGRGRARPSRPAARTARPDRPISRGQWF